MSSVVACPYFFPLEKSVTIGWTFPSRLPLGAGYSGCCRASDVAFSPQDDQLRDSCNLGYAACDRLPSERRADCVRFSLGREQGERFVVHYVYEREHAPVQYGKLEYDFVADHWLSTVDDDCLKRQAECYLASYLERRHKQPPQPHEKFRS
jgi:hypothetical protein